MRIILNSGEGLEAVCSVLCKESSMTTLLKVAKMYPSGTDIRVRATGPSEVTLYPRERGLSAPMRCEMVGRQGELVVRLLGEKFGLDRVEYEGRTVRLPERFLEPVPRGARILALLLLIELKQTLSLTNAPRGT